MSLPNGSEPDRSAPFSALRELLGDRFTEGAGHRDLHAKDASWHPPQPPEAVCFPESTEEVSQIARICFEHQIPMIAYGAGTSLEGHVHAVQGGVSVDLTRMNRILAIRPEDLDATVEAGVTRKQLNRLAAEDGLFFAVDPGADATFGGMAATRASGTNAVRYGTMRENVVAMTVVLADGRVIRTSGRARKSSAGYDLTRLFVGSEGTLGIITELTVRLYGIPEAISSAVVSFPTLSDAAQTAIEVIQAGVPVARMELLDATLMGAVNDYANLDYTVRPTLMFEFHGSEAAVAEHAQEAGEAAHANGGGDFRWATDPAEREKLWEARHHAYYASLALRPGCEGLTTDACVPISNLAECIVKTQDDVAQSSLQATLVGHVGDGNFHFVMLIDPENPDEIAEAKSINERMVARALALDGTCTGEHGVGLGKRNYLRDEHGDDALDVMRAIKLALDPRNLMNPGKILPEPR